MVAGSAAVVVPILKDNAEISQAAEEYDHLLDELIPSTPVSDPDIIPDFPVVPDTPDCQNPPPPRHPPGKPSAPPDDEVPDDDQEYIPPEETSPEESWSEDTLPSSPGNGNSDSSPTDPSVQIGTYTGANLTACKRKNHNFIAWLKVPGTNINYPVVLTDNPDYYLHHSFTGSTSKLGTLFSLGKTDYQTPGRNIAIYGHHITNTSNGQKMFRPLLSYKQKSFWEKHQTVYLDSMFHCGKYRIFAVINMVNGDWDPSQSSFSGDEEFLSFIRQAQNDSLYSTGISVSASDNILTLITCDRTFASEKGRLVIMAVEE